jgi:hypothetical protein
VNIVPLRRIRRDLPGTWKTGRGLMRNGYEYGTFGNLLAF